MIDPKTLRFPTITSTSLPSSLVHFFSLEVLGFVLRSTEILPSPKWLRRQGRRTPPPTQEAQVHRVLRKMATDFAACSCTGGAAGAPASTGLNCRGTGLQACERKQATELSHQQEFSTWLFTVLGASAKECEKQRWSEL